MSPLRILVLAPWAFRRPRNGGPLRGAAVVKAYRDAGHRVFSTGLYDAGHVKPDDVSREDVAFPPSAHEAVRANLARGQPPEMAHWNAVAETADSFEAFKRAVLHARPQVLQFEEPFLWPLVRRLRAEGLLSDTAIVHSSYNFETEAWRHRAAPGAPVGDQILRDIAALEREIASSCDLIVTVSRIDAEHFRRIGARRVEVAPNGAADAIDAAAPTPYVAPTTAYALFVSSAHPPNAHGFMDLATGVRTHPLRKGEIFVCGQVAALLRADPNIRKAARIVDRSRFLGWVDGGVLASLYAGARAVILPKTRSGGSNLKTAEALLSLRPIVATTRAFEGFETYLNAPGVMIVDEPEPFWTAVNHCLAAPPVGAVRSAETVKGLLWAECLKPMVAATEALAAEFNV